MELKPFLILLHGRLRPAEATFFKALAKEALSRAIKPDAFEQRVAAVDEEIEAIPGHGALEHVGYHALQAEHAVTHVDGVFVQE